ncbi:hypothetical protein Tco_0211617 [Tanacetum coccineum]
MLTPHHCSLLCSPLLVGTRKPTASKPSACATKKRGKQRQAKPDYLNAEAIERRSIAKKRSGGWRRRVRKRERKKERMREKRRESGRRKEEGGRKKREEGERRRKKSGEGGHFVITMSEYLRLPFLSGMTIEAGRALTAHKHVTRFSRRVEASDPKIVATRLEGAVAANRKSWEAQGVLALRYDIDDGVYEEIDLEGPEEAVGQRSSKTSSAPTYKGCHPAGPREVLHFAPKLVRSRGGAGSKDIASRQITNPRQVPLQDSLSASGVPKAPRPKKLKLL